MIGVPASADQAGVLSVKHRCLGNLIAHSSLHGHALVWARPQLFSPFDLNDAAVVDDDFDRTEAKAPYYLENDGLDLVGFVVG